MIPVLLRIFWLQLRRDRALWLLTFIVPVAFFSVFAVLIGGQGRGSTDAVRVAVVDEDGSDFSRKLVAAMKEDTGLRVRTDVAPREGEAGPSSVPLSRDGAEALVRDGKVAVALVLPKGLGGAFPGFSGDRPRVELLADTSDPVAPQMLAGMLQGLALKAAPDAMMKGGLAQFRKWGGPLTAKQQAALKQAEELMKQPAEGGGAGGGLASGLLDVKVVDLLGQEKANPVLALTAAGTAVIFLLFSCAQGAGGSLIEEVENGTLDRLLSSCLSMTRLLAGKWLSFVLLGVAQVSVMFLWGWGVFRLELWSHLPGFIVMTLITAAAAAAFGLLLGALCRSRGQLMGVSTTVILLMSALGGSMIPRFAMSEGMRTAGLFTFNAWALDGYQKVFWRDAPVWELWPQVVVLAGLTVAFLLVARVLARRWEVV
jgi:ABC-2 type transport system permease protein